MLSNSRFYLPEKRRNWLVLYIYTDSPTFIYIYLYKEIHTYLCVCVCFRACIAGVIEMCLCITSLPTITTFCDWYFSESFNKLNYFHRVSFSNTLSIISRRAEINRYNNEKIISNIRLRKEKWIPCCFRDFARNDISENTKMYNERKKNKKRKLPNIDWKVEMRLKNIKEEKDKNDFKNHVRGNVYLFFSLFLICLRK